MCQAHKRAGSCPRLEEQESFAEVAKRRMSRSLVKEVDQVELDTEC